jgi:superfamily I DNA/RNA helicase
VVFVAGLGTRFNLGDRNGRVFGTKSKIGLRAIDTERMVNIHGRPQLVASEVESSTREEELRVLYVAITRAKNRSSSWDQQTRSINLPMIVVAARPPPSELPRRERIWTGFFPCWAARPMAP